MIRLLINVCKYLPLLPVNAFIAIFYHSKEFNCFQRIHARDKMIPMKRFVKSENKSYRNPFFSTEASDRNLTIMKLDADVKTADEFSLPEIVATLTAAVSVLAPPNTWTVSNPFSVSNSENWNNRKNLNYLVRKKGESLFTWELESLRSQVES